MYGLHFRLPDLLIMAVIVMVSAKCSEVFNHILTFSPSVDMMYVNSLKMAYFTPYIFRYFMTEMIQVDSGMSLHSFTFTRSTLPFTVTTVTDSICTL